MTLVEILVVVSILAFLTLLTITFFRNQLFKGNDARRKSDLRQIQTVVEGYEKDHDCYPDGSLLACDPGTGLSNYINKIPCDLNDTSYYYETEASACPSWYRVYAKLENEADPDVTADIGPSGSYNYYAGSPNSPKP